MNQLATRLGTLGLTLAAAVVFTANLFLGLEQAQAAPIRPLAFQLLEAPDPQQFTINFDDIVSNDVPSFMACLPLGLAILKCLAQ